MQRKNMALALCLGALLAQLSWQLASTACSGFKRVDGAADCVRPEFYRVLPGVCGVEPCALACAPLASCQAFAPLPQCQCKLFLLGACSHRVQAVRDGCGVRITVFVRRLAGAEPGHLCPSGFSGSWFGTSYKIINSPTATWSDAKAACSASGGLAKFADVQDANETQWLMSLRTSGVTYHLGGYQTATNNANLMANWIWDACHAPVDHSVWRSSQPDGGVSGGQGCTGLFAPATVGMDDYFCTAAVGYICECQSVFY